MQIASQKYDLFYFNCYGKHSYKSELNRLKTIRKDKIFKVSKYFLSFKVLELGHKEMIDELNSH